MILSSDLLFDGALQGIWQHSPSICLYLEMLTGAWISNTPTQGFFDVGVGRTEWARGFCIQRDVEMHACLVEIAGLHVSGIDCLKEQGEIFEAFE